VNDDEEMEDIDAEVCGYFFQLKAINHSLDNFCIIFFQEPKKRGRKKGSRNKTLSKEKLRRELAKMQKKAGTQGKK